MSDSEFERDPIERLAESFVRRLRAGEHPSIREFAARYPDLADELQELLPTLVELERNAPGEDQIAQAFRLAADSPEVPPQQLGEYLIVREIGRGGMGVVYEAIQGSLGRHVALKVFAAGALPGSQLDRFRLEARAAAQLHHTNIVPVFGVGEHQGTHFYAMQFIPGHSLDHVIDELRSIRTSGTSQPQSGQADAHSRRIISQSLYSGHFPASESFAAPSSAPQAAPSPQSVRQSTIAATQRSGTAAVSGTLSSSHVGQEFFRSVARIGLQVADALSYAHSQSIIHRDIKPSNLLLDARGTVWITDFGLAKSADGDHITQTGDLIGTLRYMAPERIDGHCDARGDVYGLGATLYELIALRPLHEASSRARLIETIAQSTPVSLRKVDARVPRDLETIISKAIAKRTVDRYQTPAEMAEDLRRYLGQRPVLARRTRWPEHCWRWCHRNPHLAVVTSALLMVFLTGFTGMTWAWRGAVQAQRNEHLARKEATQRASQIRDDQQRLQIAGSLVDEGISFLSVHSWDDAEAAFTRAIELRPELLAAWQQRGEIYFQLGLFERAARDYHQVYLSQRPILADAWLRHASLRLYVDDLPGYRVVREQMWQDVRQTARLHLATSLVRTWACHPNLGEHGQHLAELAELVLRTGQDATALHAAALVHLRLDQCELAIARCQESLNFTPAWPAREINYPTLALAYHRLGRHEESQLAIEHAAQARERWIEELFRSDPGNWAVLHGVTDIWPIDQTDWLQFETLYQESCDVLGRELTSDDARLRVLRGRALAGLRHAAESDAEYQVALRLRPNEPSIQLEAQRVHGFLLAERQQFSGAAINFRQALALAPNESSLWLYRILAELAAGDVDSYRQSCREMFTRFADSPNGLDRYQLSIGCLLYPNALGDSEQVHSISAIASDWWLDSKWIMVGAQYRSGQYEESLRTVDEASPSMRIPPAAKLFLAMAYQRLGRPTEARRVLAEAEREMDPQSVSSRDMSLGVDGRSGGDLVAEQILFQEAAALILGGPWMSLEQNRPMPPLSAVN